MSFSCYGGCAWETFGSAGSWVRFANLRTATTLGVVTFGDYGENEKPLFRVNAGMPLNEALEHASPLLFYSQKLAMEAAMDVRDGQGSGG